MIPLPITAWTAVGAGVLCLTLVVVTVLVAGTGDKTKPGANSVSMGDDLWLLRAPLLPLVLGVVSGLVSLYALLLLFAFGAKTFKLPTTTTGANPVLVGATLIAGALTAAYAVLRLRAHLLAEVRSKLEAHGDLRADAKHQSDQEVARVDRFSKAVELLAANQAISRIAGAHLILALGDEWSTGTQRCLDVLVSHLRGLRETTSLAEETVPRGVREEVRLITSEIFRRLSTGGDHWDVRAGDFSGTALDGVDLEATTFTSLDFRGAHIFGDLSIPEGSSLEAPLLADLRCDGDLSLACSPAWTELDVSRAVVSGTIDIAGESPAGAVTGTELRAGGSLNLAFDAFHSDLMLDGVAVQEEIRLGLATLGASFGLDDGTPVVLSLVNASFGRLALRRLTRAPQIDMSGAVGVVDLTSSVFPFEVNANNLDASAGIQLRDARFDDVFTLDGARFPAIVDLDGLVLSESAQSAIESSDFALRDRMLVAVRGRQAKRARSTDVDFDWRGAIEPLRERAGPDLLNELETRLDMLAANLPLDWRGRPSFEAQLLSEVSRATAKSNATPEVEAEIRQALLTLLLPSDARGSST